MCRGFQCLNVERNHHQSTTTEPVVKQLMLPFSDLASQKCEGIPVKRRTCSDIVQFMQQ